MMRALDQRGWAKEEILFGIDNRILEIISDPVNGDTSLDAIVVLLGQRNRVARFLGLPEKTIGELRQNRRATDF